jgi:hypothetical protein
MAKYTGGSSDFLGIVTSVKVNKGQETKNGKTIEEKKDGT